MPNACAQRDISSISSPIVGPLYTTPVRACWSEKIPSIRWAFLLSSCVTRLSVRPQQLHALEAASLPESRFIKRNHARAWLLLLPHAASTTVLTCGGLQDGIALCWPIAASNNVDHTTICPVGR